MPFAGVQQVLHGHRRRTVGLIPVRGPQVQLLDDIGFDAAQLTEQELAKQRVVAVPLAPTIERHQEQVRRLQAAQLLLGARVGEQRVAQRSTQLIEHRGAAQEPLHLRRQVHHRLAVQVVGHIPILTRNRQPLTVTVSGDHRSQPQPDRPALGPFGHRGGHLPGDTDLGGREDLLGARRVQGQVVGLQFERITADPQPRQVGLLETTGRYQLRTARNPGDHHTQHVVAGR